MINAFEINSDTVTLLLCNMIHAFEINSDTVTLLLCNMIHANLPDSERAIKITKCARIIRDRTSDPALADACRKLIKNTKSGSYRLTIKALDTATNMYFRGESWH